MAAGNWMRTDKATHTKEGSASTHQMGEGRQMNINAQSLRYLLLNSSSYVLLSIQP